MNLIKQHTLNINPHEETFGKLEFERLCKLMNWHVSSKDVIKTIRVTVDIYRAEAKNK